MMAEDTATISFIPRTEGDGMESMEAPITTDLKSVINSAADSLQNLKVSSLRSPPAERIINLIPDKTSMPGVKAKSSLPAAEKKPKFVPYEPYKAAVKPIVPTKKKPINVASVQAHSSDDSKSAHHKCDAPTNQLLCLQQHYNKVVKEKEELEKELAVSSKVNAELKRLLVASVGEDMEARVHFLTEDKVKLGDDIRQYVEKIALDFEQKEKLSIEADIWRSKFLASSVVIEELTKWKSVLCNRNDELQLCIKGLLDEMQLIQQNFCQTYNHLQALNKAFDPLGNSGRRSPETAASDVVETSAHILRSSIDLSKRLLGTYTQVRDEETLSTSATTEKLSPAQLAAKQALTRRPASECSMSEMVSDMTANHVAALARRSMNKSFFTCCPHCTGKVHVV